MNAIDIFVVYDVVHQGCLTVISTGLYGRALKKYLKIKIYGGANVNVI